MQNMTRRKFLVTMGTIGGAAAVAPLIARADEAPAEATVYWAKVGVSKDFPVGEVTRAVYPKEFGGGTAYVRRDGEKSLKGLLAKCSHRGCTVTYNGDAKAFRCPCHGAQFSSTGEHLSGPGNGPLKALQAKIDDKGVVWLQSESPAQAS